MLYPAAGVILGLLVTNKREKKLPVGFFVTVLVTTGDPCDPGAGVGVCTGR